ncbi:MAG: hypothetical protein K6E73_00045 [Bacteroidales bacterium]|nr:hypothetical protein [Bacteroidales bacterium]
MCLNNGYEVILLGVEGGSEAQAYLKQFEGKDVRFKFDSSMPRLNKPKRGERRIYAYVKSKKECLNTTLLCKKLSNVLVTPNLTDSLDKYLAYAGQDGAYIYPDPDIVKREDYQEKKSKPVTPHQGSRASGWSSICENNCSMLSEVVDFSNPITRNFAVNLANESPGPYNLGQVCSIFNYLYNKWRYVNDPRGSEYVAKASESIGSANLSGDCDDFAVTMCACIIAIGGEARINTAYGAQGGHAFTEVNVAGVQDAKLKSIIQNGFPHFSVSQIYYRQENEKKWLNLDWQSSYPGGKYFNYSQCTSYEQTYDTYWKCHN